MMSRMVAFLSLLRMGLGLGLGLGLGFLLPSDEWTNVVSLTALEDHIIAVKTILANLSLGTTD